MSNSEEQSQISPEHALKEAFIQAGLTQKLDTASLIKKLPPDYLEKLTARPGWRDQRGEAQLIPPIFYEKQKQNELKIVFIGNGHIPALSVEAERQGYTPYITGSMSKENLTENVLDTNDKDFMDDVNGLMSILTAVKYYDYDNWAPRDGAPLMVIGDTHFKQYHLNLPTSETLNRLGISSVTLYVEGVKPSPNPRDMTEKGFWGMRAAAEYVSRLEAAGIKIQVVGIEPFTDRFTSIGNDRLTSFSSISTLMSSSLRGVSETKAAQFIEGEFDGTKWETLARERGFWLDNIENPVDWITESINLYSSMPGYEREKQRYVAALKEYTARSGNE